jgi:pimeloyl-ACP methyl ester carboxylesterase
MSVQVARNAGPSGIDIAHECFGAPDAPPVLLIMGLGAPDIAAGLKGDFSTAAYCLQHMAGDVGGQIAQVVASDYPARVRSLTSMMSTTGEAHAGAMDPGVMALFALRPRRAPATKPAQTRRHGLRPRL